jgi:exoribonuclease R
MHNREPAALFKQSLRKYERNGEYLSRHSRPSMKRFDTLNDEVKRYRLMPDSPNPKAIQEAADSINFLEGPHYQTISHVLKPS